MKHFNLVDQPHCHQLAKTNCDILDFVAVGKFELNSSSGERFSLTSGGTKTVCRNVN